MLSKTDYCIGCLSVILPIPSLEEVQSLLTFCLGVSWMSIPLIISSVVMLMFFISPALTS